MGVKKGSHLADFVDFDDVRRNRYGALRHFGSAALKGEALAFNNDRQLHEQIKRLNSHYNGEIEIGDFNGKLPGNKGFLGSHPSNLRSLHFANRKFNNRLRFGSLFPSSEATLADALDDSGEDSVVQVVATPEQVVKVSDDISVEDLLEDESSPEISANDILNVEISTSDSSGADDIIEEDTDTDVSDIKLPLNQNVHRFRNKFTPHGHFSTKFGKVSPHSAFGHLASASRHRLHPHFTNFATGHLVNRPIGSIYGRGLLGRHRNAFYGGNAYRLHGGTEIVRGQGVKLRGHSFGFGGTRHISNVHGLSHGHRVNAFDTVHPFGVGHTLATVHGVGKHNALHGLHNVELSKDILNNQALQSDANVHNTALAQDILKNQALQSEANLKNAALAEDILKNQAFKSEANQNNAALAKDILKNQALQSEATLHNAALAEDILKNQAFKSEANLNNAALAKDILKNQALQSEATLHNAELAKNILKNQALQTEANLRNAAIAKEILHKQAIQSQSAAYVASKYSLPLSVAGRGGLVSAVGVPHFTPSVPHTPLNAFGTGVSGKLLV